MTEPLIAMSALKMGEYKKETQRFLTGKPKEKEQTMMFTIDSEKLASMVKSTFASANPESHQPMARNIAFSYDGEKLQLFSTDFCAATFKNAKVIGDGEPFVIYINAAKTSAMAKAFKKAKCNVTVSPSKMEFGGEEFPTLSFSHDNKQIHIRVDEEALPEDMITFPPDEGTAFEIKAGELLDMLNKTIPATTSRNAYHDPLFRSFMFMCNEKDELEIFATNRQLVSRVRSRNAKVRENFKLALKKHGNVIPIKTEMLGLVKKSFKPEEIIKLSFLLKFANSNWVSITGANGNTRVITGVDTSLVAPSIDFLFVRKPKDLWQVDTKEFTSALKSSQKYFENGKYILVETDNKSIRTSIQTDKGSHSETISAERVKAESNAPLTFGLDAGYLLNCLAYKKTQKHIVLAPPTNHTGVIWLLMEKDWAIIAMPAKVKCLTCGELTTGGIEGFGKCHFCGKLTCLSCGDKPENVTVLVCNDCIEGEHKPKAIKCPKCGTDCVGIEGAPTQCKSYKCGRTFTP